MITELTLVSLHGETLSCGRIEETRALSFKWNQNKKQNCGEKLVAKVRMPCMAFIRNSTFFKAFRTVYTSSGTRYYKD